MFDSLVDSLVLATIVLKKLPEVSITSGEMAKGNRIKQETRDIDRRLLASEIKCMALFALAHQKDTSQEIETLISAHKAMMEWAVTEHKVSDMKLMMSNDLLLRHALIVIRTVNPAYDPYAKTLAVPQKEKKSKNGRGKADVAVHKEGEESAGKLAASMAGNSPMGVGHAHSSPDLEPIFGHGISFFGCSQLGNGYAKTQPANPKCIVAPPSQENNTPEGNAAKTKKPPNTKKRSLSLNADAGSTRQKKLFPKLLQNPVN